MKNSKSFNYLLLVLASLYLSCSPKYVEVQKTIPIEEVDEVQEDIKKAVYTVPEWSKNAVLYEVNIRQYTKEGTFNAFQNHLPRLKELGVDILWLMPIFPIGELERKGGMGSPYSIKDYKMTNPDFGTNADFKALVDAAHDHGMKLILDWVPNHSSFDNHWTTKHPEWYTKDSLGEITHPPKTDWTDVADLDYDKKEMRKEMTASMVYWIQQFDIDGFRCDVAGWVPNDFWMENNTALQEGKHLFLLAEWEDPELHKSRFHMTYGWELHHIMNEIAKGKMKTNDIDVFLKKDNGRFSSEDYRLNFITNHDENSWNGTIKERMGDAGDAMAVLSFTLQGMPLIYSGQEVALDKRLSFFEKDEIDWTDLSKMTFYKTLVKMKHDHPALWNGKYGGALKRYDVGNENMFVYTRKKGNDEILVILNLSKEQQTFNSSLLPQSSDGSKYSDIINSDDGNNDMGFKGKQVMKPWSYKVFAK